ncbi:PYROXD2 (predicted) [Pycnogonum litorale]
MKYSVLINSFRNFSKSSGRSCAVTSHHRYDAVVIGAGHNGLVAANYLQRSGLQVCVLERRHIVGGAAVTEEIIPGYKFSRASYVLSLLRPRIMDELELKKYGLKIHLRNPSSYTPIHEKFQKATQPSSLLLGMDSDRNKAAIAKFSTKDSLVFEDYENMIMRFVDAVDPLLDDQPPSFGGTSSFKQRLKLLYSLKRLIDMGRKLGREIPTFYELCTAPVSKIMNRWFENETLKATIATDTLIGTMQGCHTPGNGYVLLHHMMGQLEGIKGAWGYPEGGMGSVTQALAKSAESRGVRIFTERAVKEVICDGSTAKGVVLDDGTEIRSEVVLSNATPKISYLDLLPKGTLSEDFIKAVNSIDYVSPVTKINVAVDALPNFKADPNRVRNEPEPHHQCTIHLNCEHMDIVERAYQDAIFKGIPSQRPMIEMVIPSSKDKTLAPPGCHVCLLFTQFTPYGLNDGEIWDESNKEKYAQRVFQQVDEYAPGFLQSIVGYEVLPPPELEKIFGLTGGNIFHGTMSLDQLFFNRPVPYMTDYGTPLKRYYICGSGCHPGGGVMGAAGRNAAFAAIEDMKIR